jgi:CHAT domain-containing protein
MIAALFSPGQATTLLGPAATERAVQERARSGALKDFRYLHFATHGRANPDVAMSSALLLAPDPDRLASADPMLLATDGAITAEQIVQTWDLDADLVVLSACETGLGKYAGGEGYLGFAQALFVKGARSLVLSQWQVPDHATTLLMTRFYANLLGKREGISQPMSRAAALDEAKQWLRCLSVTEALEEMKHLKLEMKGTTRGPEHKLDRAPTLLQPFAHPYYWAGFILIGNSD